MSLFGPKYGHAKIDASLELKVIVKGRKPKRNFRLVLKKWKRAIKKRRTKGMICVFSKPKKDSDRKPYTAYFTPRSLDHFLKYFKQLVDDNTVVPHTDGATLNHLTLGINIVENEFREKHGSPVIDRNDRPELVKAKTLKSYPGVKFDDTFNSILLVMNTLLFVSYSDEELDNITDLHHEYDDDYSIAHTILNIYQAELKGHGKKPLKKGQIATAPDFNNFSKQNHNSVYIPLLTTHSERKQATKHVKKDIHSSLDNKIEAKYRQHRKEDYSVQHAKRIRALDSLASKKQEERRVAAKYGISSASLLSRSTSSSSVSKASKPSNSVTHKHSNSSSANAIDELSKKYANNDSNSPSAYNLNSSSASSSSRYSKQSAPASYARRQPVSKPSATVSSYASYAPMSSKNVSTAPQVVTSKSPVITTDNADTLARSMKLLMTNAHTNIPVKFQKFDTQKSVPAPATAESALKSGKLDNQRYVQMQRANFKHVANELIEQRQSELSLAFKRTQIKMITNAHKKLVKTIRKIISKYSDDSDLRKSLSAYYDKHYAYRQKILTNQRNQHYNSYKKQLSLSYQSRLETYLDQLNRQANQNLNRYEDWLNNQTIKTYNDTKTERNKVIRQDINLTKKEAISQLRNQLSNYRIEFEHRSNAASQALFTWLNKELDKNNYNWINDAAKMLKKQVRLNSVKVQLNQSKIDVANSKIDAANSKEYKARQRKMMKALRKSQEYASKSQDKYSQLQTKLIQVRGKLNDYLSKQDHYKFQVSNLQSQLSNASKQNEQEKSQTLRNLNDAEARNSRLQTKINELNGKQISDRNQLRDYENQLKQARQANQLKLSHNSTKVKALSNQLSDLQKQAISAQDRAEKLDQQNRTTGQQLQEAKQQLNAVLQNSQSTSSQAKIAQQSAVQSAISSTKASMTAENTERMSRYTNSNAAVRGQLRDMNGQLEQSHQEANNLRQTISSLRNQVNTAQSGSDKTINDLIAKTNRQSSKYHDAERKIQQLQSKRDDRLNDAQRDAQAKLARAKRQAQNDKQQAQLRLAQLQQEAKQAQQQADEQKAEAQAQIKALRANPKTRTKIIPKTKIKTKVVPKIKYKTRVVTKVVHDKPAEHTAGSASLDSAPKPSSDFGAPSMPTNDIGDDVADSKPKEDAFSRVTDMKLKDLQDRNKHLKQQLNNNNALSKKRKPKHFWNI